MSLTRRSEPAVANCAAPNFAISNGDYFRTLSYRERQKIFDCVAAVLIQQADTAVVAARLRQNHVPCCILDKAAGKPVNVSAQDTVAVYDTVLVVPTLQALLAQRGKPR